MMLYRFCYGTYNAYNIIIYCINDISTRAVFLLFFTSNELGPSLSVEQNVLQKLISQNPPQTPDHEYTGPQRAPLRIELYAEGMYDTFA